MNHFTKLNLFILLSILFFSNSISAQSFLHTSNKKIVNGSGNEVLLKGIGLGGWLLMEGYMLHTSGFANAQWEIRKAIEDLIGTTNAQQFYEAYRANYVTREDISKIAEWGFNSIRLPFHYNILTPSESPGVYLEEGFAVLDSVLAWCKDNHLYLILDLHAAPGGQSDGPICDYNPAKPSLWQDPANRDRTVEIWRKIAERYYNEEWIGGYDLLNEPAWELGQGSPLLRQLYERITDTIRVVDTNHIIFIEGNWWATTFDGLTPPWDDNMVYSFHKYWNTNDQGSIQYLVNIRNAYNVPLWLGETGENSNAWFVDCVELMQSNDIGWAWWPHKKIDALAGPLSAILLPSYQVLLDYWNGSGSKPTVTYATDALLQQADKLLIEKCNFHPDVIDALIRQPSNTTIKPFSSNEIPGIIYGAQYDFGHRGYAYDDKDYQNTSGNSGGSPWNNGSGYRNDGVDIQPTNDPFTLGFNVSWIENGEWLKFTVNVLQSGTFEIALRVSAANSGGQIALQWDGLNLAIKDVPNTGGWQNWQTVMLSDVQLTSGKHELRIIFINGGFNFNYAEFSQTAVGVGEEKNMPNNFVLKQNYPNPFNPETNIEFSLPHSGNVQIRLVDMLGKEITLVNNKYYNKGNHKIILNADKLNLSSGGYIYTIIFESRVLTRKALLIK